MTKRKKTGGRAVGAVNKSTLELEAKAKKYGLDPVEYMLKELNNEENPAAMRVDIAAKVAPYVNKKMPTAIEADMTHNFPKGIKVKFVNPDPDPGV